MCVVLGLSWRNKLFLVCIIHWTCKMCWGDWIISVSFLSALSGKEKYLCHAVVYWSQFLCLKSDASFAGAFPRNGWWQGCVSKPMWCCSNCFFRFSFLFLFFHFWLGQTVNSLNWRRVSQSHTKDGEDYMSTASTYHPPPLMLFQ